MKDTSQFNATILVINHEPDERESISMVLELDGYRVLSAETGAEGLQQAQQHPDLILCKFSLPGGYAGDAMRALLQADPETASIPVIWTMITSQHRDPTGQIYLKLPFDADDLLKLVGNCLNR